MARRRNARSKIRFLNDPERLDLFRLAWQFGEFDVDAFRSRLPSRLFTQWRAFLAVDPPLGVRLDNFNDLLHLRLDGVLAMLGADVSNRDFDRHVIEWGVPAVNDEETDVSEKLYNYFKRLEKCQKTSK